MSDYVCSGCGASECKLWREYQTFSPQLLCARCAAKDQHESIEGLDAEGFRPSTSWPDIRQLDTDQIGWYVPAIPTPEGDGWWGYTSVPPDGVAWWRALPTLAEKCPKDFGLRDEMWRGINELSCTCGQRLYPDCDMSAASVAEEFERHLHEAHGFSYEAINAAVHGDL